MQGEIDACKRVQSNQNSYCCQNIVGVWQKSCYKSSASLLNAHLVLILLVSLWKRLAEDQTSKALSELQHVVRTSKADSSHIFVCKFLLKRQDQIDRVNARKVARARRLAFFRMQRERIVVHETVWYIRVMLERLHHAKVLSFTLSETRRVVEQEINGGNGVHSPLSRVVEPVVLVLVACSTHGKDQLNDRVIEVESHAQLTSSARLVQSLHLSDQLLKAASSKQITLLHVQKDIGGIDACTQILRLDSHTVLTLDNRNIITGHLDHSLKSLKRDENLDSMKLQRAERQSISRALSEPERQRHVQSTVGARVLNQLSASESLSHHLRQTLTRLARQFLPHEEEIVVESINHMTSNHNRCTLDQKLSNSIDVVSIRHLESRARVNSINRSLGLSRVIILTRQSRSDARVRNRSISTGVARIGRREHRASESIASSRRSHASADTRQLNDGVAKVDEISITVQRHFDITSKGNRRLESLLHRLHCEVRVTIVTKAPISDTRTLSQMSIHCSQSNQIGQVSTRGNTHNRHGEVKKRKVGKKLRLDSNPLLYRSTF